MMELGRDVRGNYAVRARVFFFFFLRVEKPEGSFVISPRRREERACEPGA